jgi:very-short-patch-repair endonuclease
VRGANEKKRQRARALRQGETNAERKLWRRLSNRQLAGWKFVRQQPIGRYFADFACRDAKLVVELDGSQHAESERDRVRDAFLASRGYCVLRFWNHEVLRETQSVIDTIFAALGSRGASPRKREEPGLSASALEPEPAPHPVAASLRLDLSPQAGRGGRE